MKNYLIWYHDHRFDKLQMENSNSALHPRSVNLSKSDFCRQGIKDKGGGLLYGENCPLIYVYHFFNFINIF